MHPSKAAAEQAALEGLNREWDSQDCRDLQQEILSSSPARERPTFVTITSVAHNDNNDNDSDVNGNDSVLPIDWASQDAETAEDNWVVGGDLADENPATEELSTQQQSIKQSPINELVVETPLPLAADLQQPEPLDALAEIAPTGLTAIDAPDDTSEQPKEPSRKPSKTLRRNSRGNSRGELRFADVLKAREGEDVIPALPKDIIRKQRLTKAMDDPGFNATQKSSMSLTQENPESAYEKYRQNIMPLSSVDASEDITPSGQLAQGFQHSTLHSAQANSTSHTYGEQDTGYVMLDLNLEITQGNDAREDSQESFEEPSQDTSFAPAVSRPLESAYEPQTPAPPINPFQHRGSVMKAGDLFGATQPSSAIRNFNLSPTSSRPSPDVFNQFQTPRAHSSPLKAKDDINFEFATIAESSPAPRQTSHPPFQPRAYRSIKEIQAQGQRQFAKGRKDPDSDTDSDSSDSSIQAMAKIRNLDKRINKQLAAVTIPRSELTPSLPSSSAQNKTIIEVPSTSSRRRSTEEERPSHSSGVVRRGTQPDDVVADSQKLPSQPTHSTIAPAQQHENSPTYHHAQTEPVDSVGVTVPETSPLSERGRIRPMAEIASFSAALDEVENYMDDIPGFTQDVEFEMAIGTSIEPTRSGQSIVEVMKHGDLKKKTVRSISGRQEQGSHAYFDGDHAMSEASTQDLNEEHDQRKIVGPVIEDHAPNEIRQLPHSEYVQASPILHSADDEREGPEANVAGKDVIQVDDSRVVNQREASSDSVDLLPGVIDVENLRKQNNTNAKNVEQVIVEEQAGRFKRPLENAKATYVSTPRTSARIRDRSDKSPLDTAQLETTMAMEPESSALSSISGFTDQEMDLTPNISSERVSRSITSSQQSSRLETSSPSPLVADDAASSSHASLPKEKQPSKKIPNAQRSYSRKKTSRLREVTPSEKPSSSAELPPTSKQVAKRKPNFRSQNPVRSSKRNSLPSFQESSDDPLSLDYAPKAAKKETPRALFGGMAFAVSYGPPDAAKDEVLKLIRENGGKILDQGFDALFDGKALEEGSNELKILPAETQTGFTALIADTHSRKAKYMQALALGLPCLSGVWISRCVGKKEIVDWAPYLLCAGQSSLLNACRSRTLKPYSAETAQLGTVLESRDKLLDGRSILLVTGKRKQFETRKAYFFIARVLGPARVAEVVDLAAARTKLAESQSNGIEWDLIYVDKDAEAASAVLFDSIKPSNPKKRKSRASTSPEDSPLPKKVRVISDEVVVQSLIFGQLLDP